MEWVSGIPPSSFFSRNPIPPSNTPLDLIKKARTAIDLVALRPRKALKNIQDLCNEHSANALLFRIQAQILDRRYDEAADLDDKSRLMENAIKCAKKAITLSPNSMDFNSFLGYLFYKRSVTALGYKRAIEQFNSALNVPMPIDPALETLLTDEQIGSLGPTYEARVEVARKCILKHIGACFFKFKELKADSSIKECLQIVKVNSEEEKLCVAWYSLSVYERRHRLEEHVEGTVRKIALRKAENAYRLAEKRPQIALNQIQEISDQHIDFALLFGTQAKIWEKRYDEAIALDKKTEIVENAIKCAKKAISICPNSIDYLSFLGYLLYRFSIEASDYKRAIEQLNCALSISNPSDPAQEILFTDEELQSLSPTYEARIRDAKKQTLKHIGNCLLKLKEIKAYPVIKECLEIVKVNNNYEERVHVAWYSLSLDEKRRLIEEHVEGTVRNIVMKKHGAPTGREEVGRSLKMKEPVGAEEAIPKYPCTESGSSFEKLLSSRYNILIITGEKVLKPDYFINHIVRLRRPMSKELQKGPMALILTADEYVEKTISQFPKACTAVGLTPCSNIIAADVVVGTPAEYETYFDQNTEAEQEVEHVCIVVINNVDGVFETHPNIIRDIFRTMGASQFVFVSSLHSTQVEELCRAFSAPLKIMDLQRSRID